MRTASEPHSGWWVPGLKAEKLLLGGGALLLFLVGWTAAVRWTGTSIFPSPAQVLGGIVELAETGRLLPFIGHSLARVLSAFFAAAVIGIPLGALIGLSPSFRALFGPTLSVLRPISPLAWFPIVILLFGVGHLAAGLIIFAACFFALTLTVAAGVSDVPQIYFQSARNFGLTEGEVVRRVVLPAIAPHIVTALRVCLWTSWQAMVAAEMMAVDKGLGYLVFDARNAGKRYDLVVAAMLLIGLIGLVLDGSVRQLEKIRSIRWAYEGS